MNTFELLWLIISITAMAGLALAIGKLVKKRRPGSAFCLWIGAFLITLGYSLDSVGSFIITDDNWMISSDDPFFRFRTIFYNIRIGCVLVSFVIFAIAAAKVLKP